MKIKTARWVTLRNKQAPEMDVAGRKDNVVADKPGWDQDRVTDGSFSWVERTSAILEAIQDGTGGTSDELWDEERIRSAPNFGVRPKMIYLLILDGWNISIT